MSKTETEKNKTLASIARQLGMPPGSTYTFEQILETHGKADDTNIVRLTAFELITPADSSQRKDLREQLKKEISERQRVLSHLQQQS